MKKFWIILCLLICSLNIFAQSRGKYTNLFSEQKIKNTTRFLADDGFQGRSPGTPAGELSAKFLALQLEQIGIKPGNKGSFFQPVSLVAIKSNPNTVLSVGNTNYKFGDDFVGSTGAQTDNILVDGELVFVGYGIDASEQKWNDWKGDRDDYRGKILVMLVNDPPATEKEPNLFGGKALTYYGRWTYKLEEAARRGAAGVILIHTTDSAGYGWNVVRTSFGNWRYDVARTPTDRTPSLNWRSWMSEEMARAIFRQGGKDLDDLRIKARSRDFKPVKLGVRAKIDVKSEMKRVESNNVIGYWEGSDNKLKDQNVTWTAHWDHLGVGEKDANGDNIYNGALDNASGCASILAIAEAITKLPKKEQPKRSQVFLFTTAEEQGLLGAEWYANNPVFPLEKTAANMNHDGANFFGLTQDFGALGAERSDDTWKIVNEILKERGMSYSPDKSPEQGFFFRSDHFPFAKGGVPALSIRTGEMYLDKTIDAKKIAAEYNAKNYHQPSDNFDENWRFDGVVQMLETSLAIALKISNMDKMPKFKKDDEFAKAQPGRK
jgi:Zn-dependent M28 family amino/carboxypeptidase